MASALKMRFLPLQDPWPSSKQAPIETHARQTRPGCPLWGLASSGRRWRVPLSHGRHPPGTEEAPGRHETAPCV